MAIYYESELCHHGVKGMRWGHRKNPERTMTRAKKKAEKYATKAGTNAHKADMYKYAKKDMAKEDRQKIKDARELKEYYQNSGKKLAAWYNGRQEKNLTKSAEKRQQMLTKQGEKFAKKSVAQMAKSRDLASKHNVDNGEKFIQKAYENGVMNKSFSIYAGTVGSSTGTSYNFNTGSSGYATTVTSRYYDYDARTKKTKKRNVDTTYVY